MFHIPKIQKPMWYNRLKGGDIMDNEKVYILSKSKTKEWYKDCKKSVGAHTKTAQVKTFSQLVQFLKDNEKRMTKKSPKRKRKM